MHRCVYSTQNFLPRLFFPAGRKRILVFTSRVRFVCSAHVFSGDYAPHHNGRLPEGAGRGLSFPDTGDFLPNLPLPVFIRISRRIFRHEISVPCITYSVFLCLRISRRGEAEDQIRRIRGISFPWYQFPITSPGLSEELASDHSFSRSAQLRTSRISSHVSGDSLSSLS